MISSKRRPRREKSCPSASISRLYQPAPAPSAKRPPLSRSIVAVAFATSNTLRCGRTRIAVPIRHRSVTAAIVAQQASAS